MLRFRQALRGSRPPDLMLGHYILGIALHEVWRVVIVLRAVPLAAVLTALCISHSASAAETKSQRSGTPFGRHDHHPERLYDRWGYAGVYRFGHWLGALIGPPDWGASTA
jgi:hypothetical protein